MRDIIWRLASFSYNIEKFWLRMEFLAKCAFICASIVLVLLPRILELTNEDVPLIIFMYFIYFSVFGVPLIITTIILLGSIFNIKHLHPYTKYDYCRYIAAMKYPRSREYEKCDRLKPQ